MCPSPLHHRPLPRTPPPCAVLLLPFFLALAACGEPSGGGLEGDIEVVELMDPAVRFGSLDDPETSLVPVQHLSLSADGSVWASQGQDGQILIVSHAGAPMQRIGGLGEGPGEFGGIQGLGRIGDSLWVTDNRNDRVTFFDLGGGLLGSIPRPRTDVGDEATATFTGLLSDGALFTGVPSLAVLTDPSAPTAGDDPVWWTERDGQGSRPIAVRSGTRPQVVVAETSGGEIQSIAIFRQPWSDGSLIAIAPGGENIVVVDRSLSEGVESPAFRVSRVGLSGDTLWSTTRDYVPIAADRTRQDSVVARYAENGPAVEVLEAVLFLPAIQPPASSVFVGLDGRTWVGRESPVGAEVRRWDVFGEDGRLAGIFATPVRIRLLAADARVVWGVETDQFDVPYLVRFDLPNTGIPLPTS